MSGYYQHPPVPDPSNNNPQYSNPYDQGLPPRPLIHQLSASNLANVSRWYEDQNAPSQKVEARARRRAPAGADHIKHRRTRSGCYTCRSRRVKCDELRPICKRCEKGSRECVYPEPTSNSKSSGSKAGKGQKADQQEEEQESSSEEYDDEEDITSPVEGQQSSAASPKTRQSNTNLRTATRKQSKHSLDPSKKGSQATSASNKDKSSSPPTEESKFSKSPSTTATLGSSSKLSSVSTYTSQEATAWAHLDPSIASLFDYHYHSLTHLHYFLRHDTPRFIHTTLLEIALGYEPLLFAICGFAAFHLTIEKPGGRVQDFLYYYNRSVSSLRKSLSNGEKHTDRTLLTILQLAAFEEYLGDWVNLLGHQKAAYEMLTELYTPETVTATETSRHILGWYGRFDLMAGLMGGKGAMLDRVWFEARHQWTTTQLHKNPTDLDAILNHCVTTHGLIALDMSSLFAQLPRGEVSPTEFFQQNDIIRSRIKEYRAQIEPLLRRQQHLVIFEDAPERDPEDIVDPYQPGTLYCGPLWSLNHIMVDWYSLVGMHTYQTALAMQQQPPWEKLQTYAYEEARIIEAMQFWSGSPSGCLLSVNSSIGLIALFLPRDEKHILWSCQKLAKIESMGYIYPPVLRSKMAELWNLPDVNDWWLPNDEGLPPIIKSIRSFITERMNKPKDQTGEDVSTIKSMFGKLNMEETSAKNSPESSNSPSADTSIGGGSSARTMSVSTYDGSDVGMDAVLAQMTHDMSGVPVGGVEHSNMNVGPGMGYGRNINSMSPQNDYGVWSNEQTGLSESLIGSGTDVSFHSGLKPSHSPYQQYPQQQQQQQEQQQQQYQLQQHQQQHGYGYQMPGSWE